MLLDKACLKQCFFFSATTAYLPTRHQTWMNAVRVIHLSARMEDIAAITMAATAATVHLDTKANTAREVGKIVKS